MWEYFLFFTCNFFGFLLAMFIWHLFPKPPPFDYTTIPGLKRIPGGEKEGNLQEISEFETFSNFLTSITADYGPLSSFYWSLTYVVSVSSWKVWKQLKDSDHLQYAASPIPVFFYLISNETCPALCANFMSKNHHIKEDIAKLSITDLDNKLASWMIALKLLFHIDVDRLSYEKLSNLIEQIYEFHNELLKTGPNSDDAVIQKLTSDLTKSYALKTQNVVQVVAESLLCLAVQRSVFACLKNKKKQNDSNYISEINFENYALEVIRSAVPFDVLSFSYSSEIDLDGHPIPAKTPIIVSIKNLLSDKDIFVDPHKFDGSRFNQKKMKNICDLMLSLPYFDVLTEIVVETTKIFT